MTFQTVCFISDTHQMHRSLAIPKCDLLIHCGDACGYGTYAELSRFADWFNQQTQAATRIYVPGNHDRCVEADPAMCRDLFWGDSVMLLDDVHQASCGLRVFGTPWTPEFCGWAFQGDDTEGGKPSFRDLRRTYSAAPECDIYVCHGPYYGMHDKAHGDKLGSRTLLSVLEKTIVKPKIFACGHIHEGRGVTYDSYLGLVAVNAASQQIHENGYDLVLAAPIVVRITEEDGVICDF